MELAGSLPYSQQPTVGIYPEPHEFSFNNNKNYLKMHNRRSWN